MVIKVIKPRLRDDFSHSHFIEIILIGVHSWLLGYQIKQSLSLSSLIYKQNIWSWLVVLIDKLLANSFIQNKCYS